MVRHEECGWAVADDSPLKYELGRSILLGSGSKRQMAE